MTDPLNWPLWKKIRTLAILSFASFVGIGQATCNQGGFLLQAAVYDKTPTQVANSVSAAAAGLATGPFLWAWLSRRIGRTSVIFWAMLCNLGINVWSASMTNSDQYIPFVISRWLGGTFGSSPATIGAGIILDVFYLHQRGKGMYTSIFSRPSADTRTYMKRSHVIPLQQPSGHRSAVHCQATSLQHLLGQSSYGGLSARSR